MRILLILACALCAGSGRANENDAVYVKSVKGGHAGKFMYNPFANANRFLNNDTQHVFYSNNTQQSTSSQQSYYTSNHQSGNNTHYSDSVTQQGYFVNTPQPGVGGYSQQNQQNNNQHDYSGLNNLQGEYGGFLTNQGHQGYFGQNENTYRGQNNGYQQHNSETNQHTDYLNQQGQFINSHQQGYRQNQFVGTDSLTQLGSNVNYTHQVGAYPHGHHQQNRFGSNDQSGYFGNNQQQYGSYGAGFHGQNNQHEAGRFNNTPPIDRDVGVCYIEVPTANLAKNSQHVPAGNGSRPDLSRIRTCCKGYIRNIHNFWICDPVCSHDCVNALCTAPETCTCFPDHVKNLAGFCVPTCPIGCQNGHCAGGECLCKEGYKLDLDSKFCVPNCKENCGGIGNCTAPNTCECRSGYHSTPEGSCRAVCDQCTNGDCVAPNECRCKPGYVKDQVGACVPHCKQDCGPNGHCISPDVCHFNAPAVHPIQPSLPNQLNHTQNHHNPTYTTLYPSLPALVPANRIGADCPIPCINGACVDGVCKCSSGYIMDRTDPSGTRCIPNCPGGCVNGICSAPNFCICNMGYYKDHSVKGRPTCVKRVRRSINENIMSNDKPLNVAELLIFEIPSY